MMRQNLLAIQVLRPHARGRHDVFASRREIGRVRDREERDALVVDFLDLDLLFERPVRNQVTGFMQSQPGKTAEKNFSELRCARLLLGKGWRCKEKNEHRA